MNSHKQRVAEAARVAVRRVPTNTGSMFLPRRNLLTLGLLATWVLFAAAAARAAPGGKGATRQQPAGAETADATGQSPGEGRQSADAQQAAATQPAAQQSCSGRLLSLRTVSVPGTGHTHVVATVRANDGRLILADLGALKDLKNANLRAGQQVEASGRPGRVNNRPVLVVTRLRPAAGAPQAVTSDRGSGASAAAQVVKGTISDTRDVKIKGSSRPHTLVKVQTRDGQTKIIDLGPTGVRRDAVLHQGAYFAARGQPARLSGRPVLRAREFSDGSRVWPAAGTTRQNRRHATDAVRTVTGTVSDLRGVNLNGLSEKHSLLKVQTADGRQVVLDVGTEESAKSLGLKKGDVIAAKGPIGRINGKPVLFARQVAQVMTVDRSQRQPAASAEQQASATQSPAPSAPAGHSNAGGAETGGSD